VLYLNLSQPLFTYNQTMQALRILELDYESVRLEYEIMKLRIEQMVTTQFYLLYRSRENLEIAREGFENKAESYSIIKSKVEAGISAQEELFQAEVDFATSKADVQNLQVAYENALDNFKILLGLSADDDVEVAADVEKAVVDVDLDKAVESGLKYRMELRQMDIDIEKAKYDLVRIGAQDEFKASVNLSYGLTGDDENFGDIYREPMTNQSLSVQLHIPLWDWGKKKSRLAARELILDNQVLSREDEVDQIVLEIRAAYRSLQNQLSQIEIAEKSVENAELTYEINLERYRNGDISSKDIGEYQNQLSTQRFRHVGALIDYKLALLDLKIASLWDFENNRPVLDIE
jgi:outer membrane protein TolC